MLPGGSSIVLLNFSNGNGRKKGIQSLSSTSHMPHAVLSARAGSKLTLWGWQVEDR